MKKLNLLDQSTSFKVNDTGTIIPFNTFEDNQPFGVTENETSVFRIKNDMGFLKAVNATNAAGGYIFQLNTKDLVGLVPGTYEIELVVTDGETNAELIFPDTGFCSFNITTSALTVTGTQIPTMSLDNFKQQLEQYVQLQTNGKLDSIKSDFETYVNSVKQGPAGPQGEPGADGKPASIVVGSTTTGAVGSSASVTNSGTSSNVILNFKIPQGEQGPQGERGPAGGASSIKVGSTTTVDAGQSASVTNSGNDVDAVLDFSIPKGAKGDPGQSASVSVSETNNYNPWLTYNSKGQTYGKGYLLTDGAHDDASDVYTDYFGVDPNNSYSFSFPPNLPTLTGNQCIRVIWYDSNKSALSTDEAKGVSFPYVLTKTSPANSAYARVCFSVGDNSNTTGDNTPLYVSDNGPTQVLNTGTAQNVQLNFNLAAGPMGMQGMQGPAGADGRDGRDGRQGVDGQQGPQGPQGNIGDYVTGTGWQDLSPYMNSDVWTGWGASGQPYGWCRYAVTSINGQNIFWFRIHSRLQDASVAGHWGTKLFDIPADVQKQYGGGEATQYTSMLEVGGTPCLCQVDGSSGSRYVQTRGYLQLQWNGHTGLQPAPSGTNVTVNYEGWFVL